MKANTPEKIYIQQYDENILICLNKWNISEEWSNKPCNEKVATNIEYSRTDAFIEKVCNLLARMIWEVTYEDLEGNSIQHYDKMEFIEDVRNHMKGE